MSMRKTKNSIGHFLLIAALGLPLSGCQKSQSGTTGVSAQEAPGYDRPNIVLVVFEDMSARVGAYGDTVAKTPHFDRITAEGVRYTHAYTAAGVCAPSRAALITGRYQQSIGAQHMRTNNPRPGFRGMGPQEYMAVPPAEVKAFPELLRAAGYYTLNNGKTDYQFGEPFTIWDESGKSMDWAHRPEGMPFFAMFNMLNTHEVYLFPTDVEPQSKLDAAIIKYVKNGSKGRQNITDPADVRVPDYLPDTAEVRRDIALQYDNIHYTDKKLGEIYQRLQDEGLLENTILIVTTDHGDGLPRAKRTLYDSGLHVPFVVRYPDGWGAGTTREEMISFVDLGPTILSWAGKPKPNWMHGHDFSGHDRDEERQHIFAAQDRTDETPGYRRAVRDQRFKYIRNFGQGDVLLGHIAFRDHLPSMQRLWADLEAGTLPEKSRFLFEPLPAEQLYDTKLDPDEINNLITESAESNHQAKHRELRAALDAWRTRVGDMSMMSEAEMIEKMWPGGKQPQTALPLAKTSANSDGTTTLHLSSPQGASIGYQIGEQPDSRWQLYTGPVSVPQGAKLQFKAIRYGYAESAVGHWPNTMP